MLEKKNIDFDDIIFEHRNKDYGAYLLRKGYKKRFWISFCTAAIFIICIAMLLTSSTREYLPPPPKPVKTLDVHINEYRVPKAIIEPALHKEVKPKKEIKSLSKKVQHVPNIKNNTKSNEPTFKIDKAIPENLSDLSVAGPEIGIKPILRNTQDKLIKNISPKFEEFFKEEASTKVQTLPHYLGGDSAWYQYLKHNININVLLKNGAMPSVYTAVVAFIVHSDSTISDIKIVKDPGYGAGSEALRIVQKSGKWIPGTKNNKAITFAQLQTIVFKVNN